jgi:hypothetical protein
VAPAFQTDLFLRIRHFEAPKKRKIDSGQAHFLDLSKIFAKKLTQLHRLRKKLMNAKTFSLAQT